MGYTRQGCFCEDTPKRVEPSSDLLVNKIKIVNDKGFSYEANLEEGEDPQYINLDEQIIQGTVDEYGWGIGDTEFTVEFSINDYDPDKVDFEFSDGDSLDISYISDLTEISDGDYNYAVTFTEYWSDRHKTKLQLYLKAVKDTEAEEPHTEEYNYELPYTSVTVSEMNINSSESTQYLTDVRLGTTPEPIDMIGETTANIDIFATIPYGIEEFPSTDGINIRLYGKNKLTGEYQQLASAMSEDCELDFDITLIPEADANDFKIEVARVVNYVDTIVNSYLFSINAVDTENTENTDQG